MVPASSSGSPVRTSISGPAPPWRQISPVRPPAEIRRIRRLLSAGQPDEGRPALEGSIGARDIRRAAGKTPVTLPAVAQNARARSRPRRRALLQQPLDCCSTPDQAACVAWSEPCAWRGLERVGGSLCSIILLTFSHLRRCCCHWCAPRYDMRPPPTHPPARRFVMIIDHDATMLAPSLRATPLLHWSPSQCQGGWVPAGMR